MLRFSIKKQAPLEDGFNDEIPPQCIVAS